MKVAKLFKTELSERRFNRKILGRIHIESERRFVLELYSREADGRYHRSSQLGEADAKRLNQLARSLKKNRGVVRTGKVSLIAILVAAILVFNFGFKNRLLERALERGLEAVFAARADVEDLDFRVLSGHLSFAHLSVADREQPLRNLFELGETEVDLNTTELLKAKVIVSNLASRDIRWNTPRQSSGALPSDEVVKEEAVEKEKGGLSLNLGNLDARALIDEQLEKLSSPAQIEELNDQLRSLQAQWQDTIDQGRSDVDALAASVDTVGSLDVRSLDTLPELQQAVSDIQQAADALNRVGEDLRSVDTRIKEDQRRIAEARRSFQQAVDADVAYLADLSDLSSGELKNLASDVAAGYLQQSLGRAYAYARRAGRIAGRLIAKKRETSDRKKSDREKTSRMQRGVDIPFAAAVYPRFLLERAEVSLVDATKTIEGTLQHLSSDPDLIDKAITFSFLQTQSLQKQGEQRLSVDGELDRRETRDTDLQLGVQAEGYDLELSEGLENLGLQSLSAVYSFQTDFSLTRSDESARGRGLLELSELSLQPASGQNRLGAVLVDTFETMPGVDVEFEYLIKSGSLARVTASSSADRQLARAFEQRFAEISRQYESRLREELNQRLAAEIEDNETLSGAFAELARSSDGNLADLQSYESVLEQKQEEVKQRISDTREQATDALKSQLEKLPLPKLGF